MTKKFQVTNTDCRVNAACHWVAQLSCTIKIFIASENSSLDCNSLVSTAWLGASRLFVVQWSFSRNRNIKTQKTTVQPLRGRVGCIQSKDIFSEETGWRPRLTLSRVVKVPRSSTYLETIKFLYAHCIWRACCISQPTLLAGPSTTSIEKFIPRLTSPMVYAIVRWWLLLPHPTKLPPVFATGVTVSFMFRLCGHPKFWFSDWILHYAFRAKALHRILFCIAPSNFPKMHLSILPSNK